MLIPADAGKCQIKLLPRFMLDPQFTLTPTYLCVSAAPSALGGERAP